MGMRFVVALPAPEGSENWIYGHPWIGRGEVESWEGRQAQVKERGLAEQVFSAGPPLWLEYSKDTQRESCRASHRH